MADESNLKVPVAARPRRKPRLWQRLGCGCLAFLVAVVVAVVALELVLRSNSAHFLGTPAASQMMYEMDDSHSFQLRAGWTGEQVVGGRTTAVRVNSRGMRGPEFDVETQGAVRILTLGDSFVFGYGVADDETLAAALQAQLGEVLEVPVFVGNCGVAGHGTRDLAASLRRQRDVRPDLVVAFTYLGNDFTDDSREYSAVVEGFLLNGPMARLAHTSTRFRLALRYRTAYLLERMIDEYAPALAFDRSQLLQRSPEEIAARQFLPPQEQWFGGMFFDRRADDQLVQKVIERCRQSYRELVEVADGVPVLLVLIPTWWHLAEESWRAKLQMMKFDPADYEIGMAQRRLLALAQSEEIVMIDLTTRLREWEPPDALWLPEDRHLSVAGCGEVARWLVPYVRELLDR